MKTQFVDTYIDGAILGERRHESQEAAVAHAIEVTTRRRGECRLMDPYGGTVAVYANGERVE